LFSPAVIMDARNKCGHDRRMELFGIWHELWSVGLGMNGH
jgi:hypothetical protein